MSDTTKESRFLSIQEVAAEMGVNHRMVRELIIRGELRAARVPGHRRIIVDRRDLERTIEGWKTTPEL
jgi:excisionase family DNA binding protein